MVAGPGAGEIGIFKSVAVATPSSAVPQWGSPADSPVISHRFILCREAGLPLKISLQRKFQGV